jgi:hypothetical protein
MAEGARRSGRRRSRSSEPSSGSAWAEIRKLNGRYAGQPFPKRAAEKWDRLHRELDETEALIAELRAHGDRHYRGT